MYVKPGLFELFMARSAQHDPIYMFVLILVLLDGPLDNYHPHMWEGNNFSQVCPFVFPSVQGVTFEPLQPGTWNVDVS